MGTQSSMNIMAWAWMLWSLDAVKHERYYALGMDALVMVWAWMLWSSDAVKHERYYGLGMDALVIRCSCILTLCWFGHGCSGRRMQSSMNVIVG